MNTVLIVDDEPLARRRIKNLLRQYQTIELVGESGEVMESVQLINERKPDLVFLDIQLKAKKGFSILELVDELPMVIFTTAYSEYAIKAFDYYAIDYLLKPFNDERFHRAVSRAMELGSQRNDSWENKVLDLLEYAKAAGKPGASQYPSRIPVRLGDKTYFAETSKVQYIKASAYYAELYAEDGKHVIRESLTHLMESLDPAHFIRIHRSTIINVNYLKEVISIGFGDIEVRMTDQEQLRVSKSYKEELVRKLGLK